MSDKSYEQRAIEIVANSAQQQSIEYVRDLYDSHASAFLQAAVRECTLRLEAEELLRRWERDWRRIAGKSNLPDETREFLWGPRP